MKFRAPLVAALALVVGVGVGSVATLAAGDEEVIVPGHQDDARSLATPDPLPCAGGVVKSMKSLSSSTDISYVEDVVETLPGTLSINGPSSGKDTVVIDFGAEAAAVGGSFDYMRVALYRNGNLVGNTNRSLVGASDLLVMGSYETSWCVKVGPGTHKFKIKVDLVDCNSFLCTDNTVIGFTDDWRAQAVVYN